MGRHAPVDGRQGRRRRRLLAVACVLVAGLAVVVGLPMLHTGADAARSGPCTPTSTVRLVVAPDVAETVATILDEPVAFDGGCTRAALRTVESVQAAASLTTLPAERLPHLWVPDSSLWSGRAGQVVLRNVGSVASTPVVLGTSRQSVEELGWASRAPTWGGALTSGRDLAIPDLATSAAGIVALAAARASLGGGDAGDTAVVQAAVAAARGEVPSAAQALTTAAEGGATAPLVPLSEHQVLVTNRAREQSRLVAVYPADGSPVLDYPVLRVGQPHEGDEAAVQAVVDRVLSPQARETVRRAGFRSPAGTAPSGAGAAGAASGRDASGAAGSGVQEPAPAVLTIPPDDIAAMLDRLAALAKPSRILTVFDVSTSMHADAGDGLSRAELARDAAKGALASLPDSARVGAWFFASRLDGDLDHRELTSTRSLSEDVGGRTQREALSAVLDTLPESLEPGGTSLYDTTLAAVQAMRQSYEPDAVNTLVVVTDGRNEDSSGVQLEELLERLRSETDAERPVQLVMVGLGPDADDTALTQIAEAAGGRAYEADDPRDLQAVLFDGLRRRS